MKALVLPEVEVLSDGQADVIRNWVKGGGTLIASYKCGLLDEKRQARSNFALADVFGVDLESEERKYIHQGVEKPPRHGEYTSNLFGIGGKPAGKDAGREHRGFGGFFPAVEEDHRRRGHAVPPAFHGRGYGEQPLVQLGAATAGNGNRGHRGGAQSLWERAVALCWRSDFLGDAVAAVLDQTVDSGTDAAVGKRNRSLSCGRSRLRSTCTGRFSTTRVGIISWCRC